MEKRTILPNALFIGLIFFVSTLNFSAYNFLGSQLWFSHHAHSIMPNVGVINIYRLLFFTTVITAGCLGDLLGRKRFIYSGISLFILGAVINLLPTFSWLHAISAAFQGIGTGLMAANLLAIIFDDEHNLAKSKMVAWFIVAIMLGTLANLAMNSFSNDWINWRSLQIVSIVLMIIAFVLVQRFYRPVAFANSGSVDYLGLVLLVLASASLIFTVNSISTHGFANLVTEMGLFAFAFSLLLFAWRDLTSGAPLLKLNLFYHSLFFGGLVLRAVLSFAYIAMLFMLTLFYQHVHYMHLPEATGFLAPFFVIVILVALLTGYIGKSPILWMLVGTLLAAVGVALIARQENHALTVWGNILILLPLAIGMGAAITANTYLTLNVISKRASGAAAGILLGVVLIINSLSEPICRGLAKSGALQLVYENFLRLGFPIPHWQQQRMLAANEHLQLENFLHHHYVASFLNHFVPPVDHLYAHSFAGESTLIIVVLLVGFAFMALVAAGRNK